MIKKALIGLLALILCTSLAAAASIQTIEYTAASKDVENAQFIVKVLKYEPFPVNPGDWFDLWVKIENIGGDDAESLIAELQSDSTFDVEEPVRNYGTVPGTASAYAYKQQSGEKAIETNQVLLKFHIRVDDRASDGEEDLKLRVSTDGTSNYVVYDLPVDIAKTKTEFNINLNTISPQGATFTLSNIGDITAKAVVIDVKDSNDIDFLQKYSPAAIGDMASGAVATASLRALPNADNMVLEISYTDAADVRTTVEKTFRISKETIEASKTDFEATLNEISPQETVVAISNIGNFLAKSVTVEVKDEDKAVLLEKYAPASLGDMASGEVALAHLRLLPKEDAKDLTLSIHYTDDADSRRTSDKKVKITRETIDALCPPSKDISYLLWIYGAAGLLCGAFLVVLSILLIHRHRGKR